VVVESLPGKGIRWWKQREKLRRTFAACFVQIGEARVNGADQRELPLVWK
jgi:hypothetical protein